MPFLQVPEDETVIFSIEVMIPGGKISAPLPIFLTQCTHRAWAALGLQRGYLAVVYSACDYRDAAPDFQRAYGKTGASMALIHARAFSLPFLLKYSSANLVPFLQVRL